MNSNRNSYIRPWLRVVALVLIAAAAFTFPALSGRGAGGDPVETLSKRGSTGSEVTQIQTKLKNWGYYSGSIDGIYGSKTESAVRSFQRKNGLTVDGIAGPQTLAAMGISSSGGTSSTSDYYLLARVISAEARGESYVGQVAVGAVVLNRVQHPSFPNSVSGVVYQSGAFSCVSNGSINNTPDSDCIRAALDALNGWDPTGGCLYYYNPKTASDKWIFSRTVQTVIGNHSFCI